MSKKHIIVRISYLTVLFFSITVNILAGRAIEVQLRTQDRQDAPLLEKVQLYSSSYALVIGIDDYTNGWPRLSGAMSDARLIAAELQKKGFSTDLKFNLTADRLVTELRTFFITKGADKNARLFVWFAGHGHTIDGEGFIIPADSPRPENRVGFKLKALPMRRFGEYVRMAESKHAMAVFDSCFSGTIFTVPRSTPPAAITRATTLPVRQFVSSGDVNQKVSDNGLFRTLFIRALERESLADANRDGYVTGTELGMFLTDRMTNLTASSQTPRYGKLRDADFDRGDFVFVLDIKSSGPIDTDISFDDLEMKRRERQNQMIQWAKWQEKQNDIFDRVKQYDKDSLLTPAEKKTVWQRMLKSLEQDNPNTERDNQMRQYALDRVEYWSKAKTVKMGIASKVNTEEVNITTTSVKNKSGQIWTEPTTGMEFVWVPEGCFYMGSDDGQLDEKPVHEVCLDGFWMGRYEVTVEELRKYLLETENNTGIHFQDLDCPIYKGGRYRLKKNKFGKSGKQPMVEISWHAAQEFVVWLSKKGNGTFRLPTEAEWEYAARSGGKDEIFAGSNKVDSVAWYGADFRSTETTHEVGQKNPNGLGLFDMSGNVKEWCEDTYISNIYSSHSRVNPIVNSGASHRISRGGSWDNNASNARCANRDSNTPDFTYDNVGFRVVRVP